MTIRRPLRATQPPWSWTGGPRPRDRRARTARCRSTTLTIDAPGGSGMNPKSTNQIQFQLDITNAGTAPQPLSAVTVRYWFTAEGDTSPATECFYAGPLLMTKAVVGSFTSLTSASTPPKTATADTYLEISFPGTSVAIPAKGDTGDLKFSVNDTGYQTLFDETNDYSYVRGGHGLELPGERHEPGAVVPDEHRHALRRSRARPGAPSRAAPRRRRATRSRLRPGSPRSDRCSKRLFRRCRPGRRPSPWPG